jgi:hypothetical protein
VLFKPIKLAILGMRPEEIVLRQQELEAEQSKKNNKWE